jgi:succinate-semialdehyde dehydrogenase/glutarate-semialdehyde dehydrogenase
MARRQVVEETKGRTKKLQVLSPADGAKLGVVETVSLDDALRMAQHVRDAQRTWARQSHAFRRERMLRFLDVLSRRAGEVAELLSRETGKPLYESYLFEIIPLMHLTAYFAKRAERVLRPRRIRVSVFRNRMSYVHYKPRGVVFVISPWNFPLSIPFGEVVMGLLAGNGVLLKPASRTPLIALKLKELFDEAGFDPNLLEVMPGPGSMASEVIDSGQVDYVNFTGSTQVGRRVGAIAGKHLIPHSMELGGKDPAIVCGDADLDRAARSIVWGAFANSGQICAAVERVYVVPEIHDAFVERVVELTRTLRQGNPLGGDEIDIGSMTDPAQVETVIYQIEDAVEKGARALTGGRRAREGELFFEPTVLVDVTDEMIVTFEETFGPVMPIIKVEDEEEAVLRANSSRYGLNAYVFTKDQKKGRRIAERLEAGSVIINDTLMTHAFPETPWGGVKESGMGRVHSDEGLRELSECRHVNYELVPLANPVWYPYSRKKAYRFLAAFEFLDRKVGLTEKIDAARRFLRGT